MDDLNTQHHAPTMPCVICGSDLSGIQTLRVCPKCETPVARSMPGDGLAHSDLTHIKTLRRGWLFVVYSLIGTVIFSVLFGVTEEFVTSIALDAALLALLLSLAVFSTIGWWKLSAPEKRIEGTGDGAELRHVFRIMLLLSPVLGIASSGLELVFTENIDIAEEGAAVANASFGNLIFLLLGLATFAVNIGLFITTMLYLRWLAPRIPSIAARRRAMRTLWWAAGMVPSLVLLGIGVFLLLDDDSVLDSDPLSLTIFLFGGLALVVVCACLSFLYFLGTMRSIWLGIDPLYKAKLAEQRAAAE